MPVMAHHHVIPSSFISVMFFLIPTSSSSLVVQILPMVVEEDVIKLSIVIMSHQAIGFSSLMADLKHLVMNQSLPDDSLSLSNLEIIIVTLKL
jgi:hypothetical protein